jgi:hypothetical protein
MNAPGVEQLHDFFERLRSLPASEPISMNVALDPFRLCGFFNALREFAPEQLELNRSRSLPVPINTPALHTFLEGLRSPLECLRAMGQFCNPWKIARVGRDEVRNTAVLAWLLDPRGDHGLGEVLLSALLARVKRTQRQIPCAPMGHVNVVREARINNDATNRVDIEIRCGTPGRAFYLLIEAKIGAPEGKEQLARYAKAAEIAEGDLPWAMVYLTTDGRASRTVGEHDSRVLTLSWEELARVLLRSLDHIAPTNPAFQGFSFRLAETFLRHVRSL